MGKMNQEDIDRLFGICVREWKDYCGVSISSRTFYFDMLMDVYRVCLDIPHHEAQEKFDNAVGKPYNEYDVSFNDEIATEAIYELENESHEGEDRRVFELGYEIMIEEMRENSVEDG